MAILPAAAAAAYQSIASLGANPTSAAAGASETAAGGFGNFLTDALKDAVSTIKQGEETAGQHLAGKADIVDVVNAVNKAEITLDTVVAVRDKVVAAYQSIMNMSI